MLRKHVYPKIEPYVKTAAGFLHKKGFSPNQMTFAGLALNFVAGWALAWGSFFMGALLILAAGLADILDGAIARESGKTTPFGAFLDSVCDRYSDFFIFGGLALHFAWQGQTIYLLLTLGTLAGAYAVSYAKARAENFIKSCGVGLFDRGLRLVILFIGVLFPFLLGVVLWVLFLGSNATAVYRVIHTRKTLEEAPP